MLYVSLAYEVQMANLIKHCLAIGKKVAVPFIEDNDMRAVCLSSTAELAPDAYGIMTAKDGETVSPEEIDTVIVPGVAFSVYSRVSLRTIGRVLSIRR